MKGSIRERSPGRWVIIPDVPDASGKRALGMLRHQPDRPRSSLTPAPVERVCGQLEE